MADHQRIHPVVTLDMEAPPPSRPLLPHQAVLLRSEKRNHVQHQSPLRRNTVPAIPSQPPPRSRNSCWCRCVCWTISLLVLLLIIIAAIAGILFLVFKPKLPNYSVDNLRISDLRLNMDLSLYARFNVKITVPRSFAKVLSRSPEQDSDGCGFNWSVTIWQDLDGCFAGRTTNWENSIRS